MVKSILRIKEKIRVKVDLSTIPFEFSVFIPASFHIISLRRGREVAYDGDLLDEGLKKYVLYEGRYLLVATLRGKTYVTKIRFNPAYVTGFYLQPWGGSPPNNLVRAKEYYLLRPNRQWELVINPVATTKVRTPVFISH